MRGLARWLILPSLALVVVATPLEAQDRRERRSQDRQEMERRLRDQMSRMIREELDLNEAEYEPVSAIMERFTEERRQLWRAERDLRRTMEALAEGRREDTTDPGAVLERLLELREREAAIFRQEQEALLEHLTPTQVLELHALRERISRRMRELRGRRGNGERDRGGFALGAFSGTIPPSSVSL